MASFRIPFPEWMVLHFGDRHSPAPDQVTWVHQIHSNNVLRADGQFGRAGDGDALISNHPGCLVGVRTADCVPILLADPEHRAVAAVHAGWRGTLADVAGAAVAALGRHYASQPGDLMAAIGPSIGPCCFEVGADVAARFRGLFPERADLDRGTTLDLAEANRRLLIAAGLAEGRIWMPPEPACTACHPERYHSWRRDRERAGRMWSTVGIRA